MKPNETPKYAKFGKVKVCRNDVMSSWELTHEECIPHCVIWHKGNTWEDVEFAAEWLQKGIEYGKLIAQREIRGALGIKS